MQTMGLFFETMDEIIHHLANYKESGSERLEQSIQKAVDILLNSDKIFVYGAGRSGMVGRMFAQRLMHLDLKSVYLSETITPAFTKDDCLLVISGSGETLSPKAITKGVKDIGGKVIALTANPESSIGKMADKVVEVKGQTKDAKQEALAPFTSLFDITAIVVCDSIARVIMNRIGKTEEDIHRTHATLE
ncbi:MAG: 6-phospho-3-hexuloisomerase [Candidatus Hodarchaeales archaeon]